MGFLTGGQGLLFTPSSRNRQSLTTDTRRPGSWQMRKVLSEKFFSIRFRSELSCFRRLSISIAGKLGSTNSTSIATHPPWRLVRGAIHTPKDKDNGRPIKKVRFTRAQNSFCSSRIISLYRSYDPFSSSGHRTLVNLTAPRFLQ